MGVCTPEVLAFCNAVASDARHGEGKGILKIWLEGAAEVFLRTAEFLTFEEKTRFALENMKTAESLRIGSLLNATRVGTVHAIRFLKPRKDKDHLAKLTEKVLLSSCEIPSDQPTFLDCFDQAQAYLFRQCHEAAVVDAEVLSTTRMKMSLLFEARRVVVLGKRYLPHKWTL